MTARSGGRDRACRRWAARILGLAIALVALAPLVEASAGVAAASPCQSTTAGPVLSTVNLTIWQPAPGASDSQARQCTPPADATLTGTWTVDIDANSLDSLATFAVQIVPTSSGIPPLPPGASVDVQEPAALSGQSKFTDTIKFSWDTTKLTPYNGVYQISATATSLLDNTASTTIGGLAVNNPPSPPTAVAAGLAGSTPVVSWKANPEPDIRGYQILRSTGGAYSPVASVTSNTFDDTTAPQGGSITYEVIATRSSPTSAGTIASAPSSPSNAVTPGAVIVPSILAPPSIKPLPKLPAPKPVAAAAGNGTVGAVDNTFAPTLPFSQTVPTQTLIAPPPVAPSVQALAGDGPQRSTTAQTIKYLATAAFLLVAAAIVYKVARRLLRDP